MYDWGWGATLIVRKHIQPNITDLHWSLTSWRRSVSQKWFLFKPLLSWTVLHRQLHISEGECRADQHVRTTVDRTSSCSCRFGFMHTLIHHKTFLKASVALKLWLSTHLHLWALLLHRCPPSLYPNSSAVMGEERSHLLPFKSEDMFSVTLDNWCEKVVPSSWSRGQLGFIRQMFCTE